MDEKKLFYPLCVLHFFSAMQTQDGKVKIKHLLLSCAFPFAYRTQYSKSNTEFFAWNKLL